MVNGTNKYEIISNQSVVLENVRTIQFFCIGNSLVYSYKFSGSFSPTIYDEFNLYDEYLQETSTQIFNITQDITINTSLVFNNDNAGGGIIVED